MATKYAAIKMETAKVGTYKYKLKAISDGAYDADHRVDISPLYVEQTVCGRPSAVFTNKGKVYKSCANTAVDEDSFGGIPVQLSGQPPFALTVEIHHESTGKTSRTTIKDINDKSYRLKKIFRNLQLGRHSVAILKVVDSIGCSREVSFKDETVTIIVSDVPKLTEINQKQDYCVGERIAYALDGVPPFEIVYEFNGKRQKANSGSTFSRLASIAGNLTLISLSDSASNCQTDLHQMPGTIIHPIPSVSIREESARQHIHEGDQAELVFHFTGTPPFSFTYTRSEYLGKPPKLKPVESHSVANVEGHEYSIFTSTQGTYEVVSMEDAHCSVSNR